MKAFFESVRWRTESALAGSKRVFLIPVGSVIEEVQRQIEQGTITHWNSVLDLYMDEQHFKPEGSFLVVATWLATVYQQNPKAYNLLTAYPQIDSVLAAQLNDLVWDVVSHHPDAGIQQPLTPFIGWVPAAAGLKNLGWFGSYDDSAFPLVDHANWGLLFIEGDNPDGFYAYSWHAGSWLWINQAIADQGMVYHFGAQQWVFIPKISPDQFWVYWISEQRWEFIP